jgi:hypothetical protein
MTSFVYLSSGTEGTPCSRQNLVAGDQVALVLDLPLPITDRCLLDQASKRRVIPELFDPERSCCSELVASLQHPGRHGRRFT